MKPGEPHKIEPIDFRSTKNLGKAYTYLERARSKMQNGMSFLTNLERNFVTEHGNDFFRLLSECLESGYTPTAPGYYFGPKSHFGLRPMSVLPLADAVAYQAILNPLVLGRLIDSKLQNGVVFANRVDPRGKTFFRNYKKQYTAFVLAQRRSFEKGYPYRVELDVQNYYQSIDHDILRTILGARFGVVDGTETELLFSLLRKWSEQRHGGTNKALRRGIPQGYEASDLLANAYLAPIDDFVKERYGNQVRFFRYNDDMVLMLKSPETVNRVIADISAELLKLGLSLNGKSGYRKIENVEEFDTMAFAPYGEPELVGVDTALDVEKVAKDIFKKLNAGEDVEKQVASKMKYYLRTGGIFSAPYAIDATDLLFKRPEFSFHASEYLEWRTPNKDIFTEIWKRFLSHGRQLTDWQLYCVARLLGLSAKNLKENRRWKKLATTLAGNGHWLMKILGGLIVKQHSPGWGRGALEQLSAELHEPVAWQYLLFLADWSGMQGIGLPPEADGVRGTALQIVRQVYLGEFAIEPDDTPPEPATPKTSVQHEVLAITKATLEGVQELLKRPRFETQSVPLRVVHEDKFLHVQLGKQPALQLPMRYQHTHVLSFLIKECEQREQQSIGVDYKDVWEHLINVGPRYGFSVPKSKEHRNTKKSIDRHIDTLETKLRKAFPGLRKKEIFKRETGGLIFNR